MAATYNSIVLWVLVPVLAVYFHYLRFLRVKRDWREPPVIRPTIPLIGHIIGLLRYGTDYYAIIK